MGRYTLQDNPLIDQVIEGHLDQIRAAVLSHTRPQALLLAGSFGRGEGSVSVEAGEVRFHSDYEICLISPTPSTRFAVDRVTQELSDKLPVPLSLFWNTPARLHNNRSRNLSFGKPQATIGMYELKAGSQIFYGKFDLTIHQFKPADISANEGVRLIINRMMEVVETALKPGRPRLEFAAAKLALACGDALLLQHKLYHYSYAERARRFAEHYPDTLPQAGGDFGAVYDQAARFKLNPFSGITPGEVLANLPMTRLVSRTVLGLLLGAPQASDEQILLRSAQAIPVLYHTGLLTALDPYYENLILALRTWRAGRQIDFATLHRVAHRLTAFQALYGAIPALFWGLPLAGDGSPSMLELAAQWGAWAYHNPEGVKPELLAQVLLDFWHIMG